MNSILDTIKKMLGLSQDDEAFDTDLIVFINSSIMVLSQLGLDNAKSFSISDNTKTWSDLIGSNENIELVKSLLYLKVKILFDTPSSSFVLESYNKQIEELSWRLRSELEPPIVEEVVEE